MVCAMRVLFLPAESICPSVLRQLFILRAHNSSFAPAAGCHPSRDSARKCACACNRTDLRVSSGTAVRILLTSHSHATVLQHLASTTISLNSIRDLQRRHVRPWSAWLLLLTALQAAVLLSAVGAGSTTRKACPTGCLKYGTCYEELGRCGIPSHPHTTCLLTHLDNALACLAHPVLN